MRTWVVGGTSGIGKACATVLRSAGHVVAATGSEVDVREARILGTYARERGPFDALVYSAGINYLEWCEDLDIEEATNVYNVNVLGLIRVLHAMAEGDCFPERCVVIGSDAAWKPLRTSVAYNASKAALHAAVQCIARESASEDFAINVVAPGLTESTGMTEYVRLRTQKIRGWTLDALDEYMVGQIPLGRPAQPVEIAYVVRDVLESSTYLNGAIIPVNGGR